MTARILASVLVAVLCGVTSVTGQTKRAVTHAPFGRTTDGQAIEIFTLTNTHGIEVKAMTYGCIITSLRVPDRNGKMADVVLGYNTLDGYLKGSPYFGAVVGRYGNRIAKGQFTLDGKTYKLATNNGANHLHGGNKGFDKVVWHAAPETSANGVGVVFTRTSQDGEEGYPGNLQVTVTYTLTDNDALVVGYRAVADKATPVNLTQHSYFNLAADDGDILGHQLTIDADRYTPVDDTLIPTGELARVAGTPFDFRTSTAIGARINTNNPQLKNGNGYDHNWVLNAPGPGQDRAGTTGVDGGHVVRHAVRVVEPKTGRTLDISTSQPGVQFYSGNFLDGSIKGKGGRVYKNRSGFCLETQHYPDSPNHPNFPTTILKPGQEYVSETVFTFGVQK
jgi:aldose 1-epimerase